MENKLTNTYLLTPNFGLPKNQTSFKISNNDISHNDSVIELIKSMKINWLQMNLKAGGVLILYDNKNIDVKYKFMDVLIIM